LAGRFKTDAFPGLGTEGARITFNACARQVRTAIDEVVFGLVNFPRSTTEAFEREKYLTSD